MKNYTSPFGSISDSNLILHKLDNKTLFLEQIREIKIIKRRDLTYFFNLFTTKEYDFTIVMDDQKEIEFSFPEKKLKKAFEFKNRILHTKFCYTEFSPDAPEELIQE